MSLIDIFWNLNQDNALVELKKSQLDQDEKNEETVERLQQENRELQLRVGVLIRLLIERDVFSADDYAIRVNETKVRLQPPGSSTPSSE